MGFGDKPSEFRPKTPLYAEDLNKIVRMVSRQIVGDGVFVKVKNFGDRVLIQGSGGGGIGGSGSLISLFEVQEEKEDYLLCKKWNPATETTTGDMVAVAKPYQFRKSSLNGKSVKYSDDLTVRYTFSETIGERTAHIVTDEGVMPDIQELQAITPPYYGVDESEIPEEGAARSPFDLILAAQGPTGLTYLKEGESEPSGITWTDINNAGRAWAEKWEATPQYEV